MVLIELLNTNKKIEIVVCVGFVLPFSELENIGPNIDFISSLSL